MLRYFSQYRFFSEIQDVIWFLVKKNWGMIVPLFHPWTHSLSSPQEKRSLKITEKRFLFTKNAMKWRDYQGLIRTHSENLVFYTFFHANVIKKIKSDDDRFLALFALKRAKKSQERASKKKLSSVWHIWGNLLKIISDAFFSKLRPLLVFCYTKRVRFLSKMTFLPVCSCAYSSQVTDWAGNSGIIEVEIS